MLNNFKYQYENILDLDLLIYSEIRV